MMTPRSLGNEFQVNTTTYGSQMHQTLGSDGSGRLLAAWTRFGAGIEGFVLYGQQNANPALAVVGTNDNVFASDPNSNPNSVSNAPTTTTVVLQNQNDGSGSGSDSNSVTLSFSDVKGTYNGLIFDPNGVTVGNSGYVTITTSAKGAPREASAREDADRWQQIFLVRII